MTSYDMLVTPSGWQRFHAKYYRLMLIFNFRLFLYHLRPVFSSVHIWL